MLKESKAAYVQQIINFSAPFPWFLTIAGALEYEIPVVFSLLLPQCTVRQNHIDIQVNCEEKRVCLQFVGAPIWLRSNGC